MDGPQKAAATSHASLGPGTEPLPPPISKTTMHLSPAPEKHVESAKSLAIERLKPTPNKAARIGDDHSANSTAPEKGTTILRSAEIRRMLAAVDRYSTEVTEALESESLVAPEKQESSPATAIAHSNDKRLVNLQNIQPQIFV